jgi:predicted metalloprotease with PDZ domain
MRHALLVAGLLACAAARAAGCDLEYTFTTAWAETPRRFEVTLRFDAGERRLTRLRLSTEWGGVSDFERGLGEVRAANSGTLVTPGAEPRAWDVRHPASGRVEVRYAVLNDVANVDAATPLAQRDFYRNALGASHFQVFGHGALLQPEHLGDADPIGACLTFTGLPRDWAFASSHGQELRDGVASIRTTAAPQALRGAVYLGGDFRVHRRTIEGRPLLVAMRGKWSFDDARFADSAAAVVAAHRRFWKDFDFPTYLISLVPNRLPRGSTGGTQVANAFAMHASNDFAVPGPAFDQIIAHEHLHTWVPRRLGTMGEGEAARYWFSEGFTNYLTHRLQVRAGVWRLEDYARELNRVVFQYAASPAREATNERVAKAFWTDPAMADIPYIRGELLALLWDRRLSSRGTSLDAVLRELLLDASRVPKETAKRAEDLAVNRLRQALATQLGPVVEKDVAEHIERGRPFELGEDFLGPCFIGSMARKARFELGFDAASFRAKKVTGLVAGSQAESAGLREGMELAGWSVDFGDAGREAKIQVREAGKVRSIDFMPAGERIAVREFRVRPGAMQDDACLKWMNGGQAPSI